VLFRDGPSGRRAVLAGGPDVWEVVRVVKSALPPGRVLVALDYWMAYSDEIELHIRDAEEAERAAGEIWQLERRLPS
jgi:hypothetical protein